MVLVDQDLVVLRCQLRELFGQSGVWGEDWGAFWSGVHDVDDGALEEAVTLEESGDGGAGVHDVLGYELSVGVPG